MPLQEMLAASNCAMALIDFQPAMFQGVQSHDRKTILDNVQILASMAKVFGLPTVLSTVSRDTFSGPFMPEVAEGILAGHQVIDRTSINAWLDADFRAAVEVTGKRRLVLAGLWTSACVTFPTLDLLRNGYEVFAVADACGDTSREAHDRAMDRIVQAGAVPLTTLQLIFELQQDWARKATGEGVLDILRGFTPYGTQIRFSKWALGERTVAGKAAGRAEGQRA